ncbi:MFS transporter (plasmid) [Sinorhizobium chiapasense]|uniref:MFS transporter n=1 Tax=Sinorhizobium chiapasense TaxID=501572 RepID=UPI002FE06118
MDMQELERAVRCDTIPSEPSSSCASHAGFLARIASSLLLYPGYRRLWISNLFFFAGVWTQTLVLGWLVFDTTRSEFSVALFTAARLGPMMLGPLAGVVSDRFDRPRLLLAASGWAFTVLSAIALLVALDKISFWGLVFGGFCIGLAQSPSQPARFALVADLVDRERLSNANALNSLVLSMTQMIGPALGGTMIVAFGAASALAISAGWYLVSFIALWPMRNLKSRRQPVREEDLVSLVSLVAAGFRTISENVLLRSVLGVTFLANILLWPIYQGFMPVIAKEHLGLTPTGLGWLLACAGTGSLAGALVIASLGDFRYKGGLFLIGTAIWGGLWATFALSSSMPLSFVLMGLIGLSASPFGVLQTTLMLMMTEPHVQGRVMGIQELTIGVMPVSSLVLGAAAEIVGIANVALISGTLLAVSLTLLALRVPELLRYSGHNS